MTQPFALKYRPRRFRDVVGQKMISIILNRMVVEDAVPAGLLFTGTHGTGKTTMARILAMAVNCPDADQGEPCRICSSCQDIAAGVSLDVIEVDGASNGTVGQVREIIQTVRYSVGGGRRVVIFDEAQSMSREAHNALLKPIEEPVNRTIFILVTTEPQSILKTTKSRLLEFEFRQVSSNDILDRLTAISVKEEIEASTQLLSFLAERSNGSVRDAVMSLDLVRMAHISTPEEYISIAGETDFAPVLVRVLASGDHARIFSTLDQILSANASAHNVSAQIVQCLADVLILRSGGSLTVSGLALQERIELVKILDPDRILAALRLLWDLKTKIRVADDPKGNLKLALVLVADVFTRGKKPAPAPVPQPVEAPQTEVVAEAPRKLTLAEMQGL